MNLRSFFRFFPPLPTILIFLVAAPLLFIGFIELYKAQSMMKNLATAQGAVTGTDFLRNVNAGDNSNSSWAIHPKVRFTTPQGQEISFTDSVGSNSPDYEVGDKVEVLYNPENPQEAMIKNWKQVWITPLWITGIGFLPILGLLGWVSWKYVQSERKNKPLRKAPRR